MKNGLKYCLVFFGLAIIQQLMRELGYGNMLYIALSTIPFAYYSYLRAIETNNSQIASVILALLICVTVLSQIKDKSYFKEIYYVWKLKQLHNRIYRKFKKIKLAAKNDINALTILNFYYHSRKQVYLLDDNTLTIPELNKDIKKLDQMIAKQNLIISLSEFKESLLKFY